MTGLRGRARGLARDRRSAVALLFGLMLIPLIGIVGLAVDGALYFQARAAMAAAANGAVTNALKIAVSGELNNDANYIAEGETAGQQWFTALLGSTAGTLGGVSPAVAITGTTTITGTVTATATMTSVFGNVFGFTHYALSVSVAGSVVTHPYLQVVLLLDNSASMEIGASNADISTLSTLSPCDPSNAFYLQSDGATWINASNNLYSLYSCQNGGTYDGVTPCPVAAQTGLLFSTYLVNNNYKGPQSCHGVRAQYNGLYPGTGPPCAFACHWTNTASSLGGTADLYGMARRNGVTLRFDIVKTAAMALLKQMQTDNLVFNNLSVGVYTFDSTIKQIYPAGCTPGSAGCEAGSNFTLAQTLVGAPPVLPNVTDTGITPPLIDITLSSNDDTAFQEITTSLATTYVTAGGTGTSAAAPKKVLFLITDGVDDDPNYLVNYPYERKAMAAAYCQQFKNMGYTVYVALTPYYPIMHVFYESFMIPFVEGSGSNSISYQMLACSSGSGDFVSVTAQGPLTSALLTFLQQALTGPVVLTK